MSIKLDMESIKLINFFENFTKVKVKDCLIKDNFVYFITEKNQAQFAIGKNGVNVKRLERKLGKNIKVFEYSDDLVEFVKNIIPKANLINIKNENNEVIVEIKLSKADKPIVIGRDGKNLNIIKEILRRNSNVNDLIIR
jgi:N utilization substance protein A